MEEGRRERRIKEGRREERKRGIQGGGTEEGRNEQKKKEGKRRRKEWTKERGERRM